MPILVPCLVALRTEFNLLAPKRDKGADGWIGDAAHQQEVSDHNGDESGRTPFEDSDNIDEVHAIDIDKDLGYGLDLGDYVEIIRLNHLHGRDNRLQNIIWHDRVASRSWGWTWDPRPGIGHYDHAHFSARYTTAQESDTSPWGVYPKATTAMNWSDTFSSPSYTDRYAAGGNPSNYGTAIILAAVKAYDAAKNAADAKTAAEAAKSQAITNGIKLDAILSKLNSWDATSGLLDDIKRDTGLTQVILDGLTKDPRIVGYDSPIALNVWWAGQHPEGPTE